MTERVIELNLPKKAAARRAYRAQPGKTNAADRAANQARCAKRKAMFKACHKANCSARLRYFRKYHCVTKRNPVAKAKYRLAKPTLIDQYVNIVKANLRTNPDVMSQLEDTFKARHCEKLSRENLEMTVGAECRGSQRGSGQM